MRRIIVSEFVSLDGVMESPAWTAPYWNDDVRDFKLAEDATTDALLLGRVTYQEFAAVWPESEDEGAERINGMPKYVVSTTLDTVEWNNSRLINGDIVEELTTLKQQAGQDLLVYGSATLVHTLMEHDLVDSYRLLVYPVIVGHGKRLFKEGATATLKLVEARPLRSGVVALVYTPERT